MDEYDFKAQYERLRATDADFEAIRQSMREIVSEECPEREHDFSFNYEIFLRGYEAVKKARHNRFDPNLVERSRRGDIDAAQEMLIRAGIIDSLKLKEK